MGSKKQKTPEAPWRSRIVKHGEANPADLIGNPFNFKIHHQKQHNAVTGLLNEVGWVTSVIVNITTGHLVDGHMRTGDAAKRGEPTIPVTYVELTEAEELLILATLDPSVGQAGVEADDYDKLLRQVMTNDEGIVALLTEYAAEHGLTYGDDPKNAGSNADDGDGSEQVSKAEELQLKWQTESGQLWLIKSAATPDATHRVLCGDARSATDAERLMNGDEADMVWIDPPYNVAYTGKTADAMTIQNDQMGDGLFYHFLKSVYENIIGHTKPGGAIYVCHADSEGANFRQAMKDAGWLLKQCLIWVKQVFVLGRQDYHWRHEPILYGWKPGAAHYFTHDRTLDTVFDDVEALGGKTVEELIALINKMITEAQTSVWHCDRPAASELHPTMKPVPLVQRAIENSTREGERIVDFFGGSGSALMAAEQAGREAYVMELDPKYLAVILERAELLGLTPELA
jgi:DNA modification methylase